MKRKVISLMMATAMSLSLLAGCTSGSAPATSGEGSGDANTAAAAQSEDNSGSGEAAAEGVTEISVYRCSFNVANPDSAQVQKVQDAINEYIADKIPVKIKLTDIGSGEYTEKANLALANKEINLLWTASWEGTIGTNDLVPQNAVYDLTDIVPGSTLYGSMAEGQWEAAKYDGKIFFVPVYKDNVEGYDFMFRQDLIDQFGWDITTVKELKDLEPMLADAKDAGLKYPFLTQKTAMFYRWYIDSFDFFTADAGANFVAVDRSKDEVVDTITTPEYLEFCTLMAEWAEKGYISEDDVTKTTNDQTTQTQDWAVTWWTDIPVNDEADARYGQDVTMQPATDRWAHSTSALGSCYCVTANSTEAQAKACVDFLGLLYTDSKLADMYTFGIEGEDFTYDANGQVEQTSEKYNHSMWESANATIVTPLANEPANKAELYDAFNGGANTSCAAGFRFDKSPVEDKYAACANVAGEYGFALENGGVAVADVEATIAAYQAALDEAGYQDVLAEFQNQYNAWKASK
ncbi:ABC transporter substrate-binding protein [Butyrivibrio proteoclasticus]|uniref:ABC transporter substrate-binding protein n=1 Tax=Butyrivibrio proteoclasticus TaxID=43305 RepID=UPI00047A12BC|nr:ABC transporter substrate-binding protein [Butyrivibrio proteoclasticus]